MRRIALISAILENPATNQHLFNEIVSEHKEMVRGRMGLPFEEADLAVISITVVGVMDSINSLTGKLGKIPNVQIKTAISKKEIM